MVQQGAHRPVNMATTLLPSLMNGRHVKEKGKKVAQPSTAGELHRGTELVVSFSELAVCNCAQWHLYSRYYWDLAVCPS